MLRGRGFWNGLAIAEASCEEQQSTSEQVVHEALAMSVCLALTVITFHP